MQREIAGIAKPPYRVFLAVFVVALAVRGIWHLQMMAAHGETAVVQLFPDSIRYDSLALFLNKQEWQYPPSIEMLVNDPLYRSAAGALVYSAPGYPAFVALVYYMAGVSAQPVLVVQSLLSSLSCVLIACLAWQCFASWRISICAGIFAALSMTSVALSAALATETLFNVLFLASVVGTIAAAKRGGESGCFLSSFCLTLAGLVKPVVLPWPLVVLACWMIWLRRSTTAKRDVLLGVLCLIYPFVGWIIVAGHVQKNFGIFTLGEMGTSSMRWMWTARALNRVDPSQSIGAIQAEWRKSLASNYQAAHRQDLQIVRQALRDHPVEMTQAYFMSVFQNTIAPDDLHAKQLPQYKSVWNVVDPLLRRIGIPGLLLAGAAGWVAMWRGGARGQAALLAVIYCYFSLLSGVAYWQGSRYLYPADSALWIVLAWAAVKLWERCRPTASPRHADHP